MNCDSALIADKRVKGNQKLYSANNWIATVLSDLIKEQEAGYIKSYIPRIIELRLQNILNLWVLYWNQKLYSANNWIATFSSLSALANFVYQKLYSANNWIATLETRIEHLKIIYQKLYSANNWIATKGFLNFGRITCIIKSYIPRIIELRPTIKENYILCI